MYQRKIERLRWWPKARKKVNCEGQGKKSGGKESFGSFSKAMKVGLLKGAMKEASKARSWVQKIVGLRKGVAFLRSGKGKSLTRGETKGERFGTKARRDLIRNLTEEERKETVPVGKLGGGEGGAYKSAGVIDALVRI